jgi:hypothetical protein
MLSSLLISRSRSRTSSTKVVRLRDSRAGLSGSAPSTQGENMRTRNKAYPANGLITITAAGKVDLVSTRMALEKLAGHPDFKPGYQLLFDWRKIKCALSLTDVYEISKFLADPDTALPTRDRVAVLVSGDCALDRAKFLELCAANRGVTLVAFDDCRKLNEWLDAGFPEHSKERASAEMSQLK